MKRYFRGRLRSLKHGDSGFTLVELLVVVGIIVALAAVIIPNVATFAGRVSGWASRTGSAVADMGATGVAPLFAAACRFRNSSLIRSPGALGARGATGGSLVDEASLSGSMWPATESPLAPSDESISGA